MARHHLPVLEDLNVQYTLLLLLSFPLVEQLYAAPKEYFGRFINVRVHVYPSESFKEAILFYLRISRFCSHTSSRMI